MSMVGDDEDNEEGADSPPFDSEVEDGGDLGAMSDEDAFRRADLMIPC